MYNGQLAQDVWVDEYLGRKEGGTFIDVGACRPSKTNNTHFFENVRGWTGILVEPNPLLIPSLEKERPLSSVVNALAWDRPDLVIPFRVLNEHYSLSTAVYPIDGHERKREGSAYGEFDLYTVSLSSLMDTVGWDSVDYVSVDVEGAEFLVLEGMDHDGHFARCVTVEHNQVENHRSNIYRLMSESGYLRVSDEDRIRFKTAKNERWFWNEDWYVKDI